MERVTMTPAARKILDAAGRLFYDRGIHAVGVDLIAAEAGTTKKTLYDRFGSKDVLVAEYLADRDERWRTHLAERTDRIADPAARLRAVFEASRAWMRRHGAKGCSMVNAHAEVSDPAHPAHAVMTGQKAFMLRLFTELAAEIAPDRDDAAVLGRTLMLLHEGALAAHGLGVFPDPIGEARDRAAELAENIRPVNR